MKVSSIINEATIDNVQFLKDVTRAIFGALPMTMPAHTGEYRFRPNTLVKASTVADLQDKYPDKADLIDSILNLRFVFDFEKKPSTGGMYDPDGHSIHLYYRTIYGDNGEPLPDTVELSDPEAKAILVHELRHVVQDNTYGDYAKTLKHDTDEDYDKNPMEIDAVFHQLLSKYIPKRFHGAQDYAETVVQELAYEKTLTPHYRKHYYRKAAAYWGEVMRKSAMVAESTAVNFSLLDEVTTTILKYAQRTIRAGESITLSLKSAEEYVDYLHQKYPNNTKDVDRITQAYIIFSGKDESISDPAKAISDGIILGWHNRIKDGRSVVQVNVYALEKLRHGNQSTKMPKSFVLNRPEVKAVLVHELRHAMQSAGYGEYFTKAASVDYDINPLEIDAMFHEVLSQHQPSDYKNSPDVYADVVTHILGRGHKLSPHYKKHYYRKAAAYWTEVMKNADKVDTTTLPMDQRLDHRRGVIRTALLKYMDRIKTITLADYIDDYSADKPSLIERALVKNLMLHLKNRRIGADIIGALILLLVTIGAPKSVDRQNLAKAFELLTGTTVDSVIAQWENGDAADRLSVFDADAIARYLRKAFQPVQKKRRAKKSK